MEGTDCHDEVEGGVLERQLLRIRLHGHDVGGQIVARNVDGVADVDRDDSRTESMGFI